MSDIDWVSIRAEYEGSTRPVIAIARDHGISHTAINKRARNEGWRNPRKAADQDASNEAATVTTPKAPTTPPPLPVAESATSGKHGRGKAKRASGKSETVSSAETETGISAAAETSVANGETETRNETWGDGLTLMQRQFVREFLIDLNATQAAIRAGFSEKSSGQQSYQLLQKPAIAKAIAAAMQARAERTDITADRVLAELWSIATADPNELVEHRIGCCRFCWGQGFLYQRTPNEMRQARADYERALAEAQKRDSGATLSPFDEAGGEGYNATRAPNPACPECFGQGVGRPVFRDSRLVSAGARSLYAGVKVTRDGMEMKLHDKGKALELLGRHLGMFVDRKELSGPNGGPVETESVVVYVPSNGRD